MCSFFLWLAFFFPLDFFEGPTLDQGGLDIWTVNTPPSLLTVTGDSLHYSASSGRAVVALGALLKEKKREETIRHAVEGVKEKKQESSKRNE